MEENRSAKSSRMSNSEMTIDLISDLQPNEEEDDELRNKRVFAGRVFTDAEIKKSRFAELDRLEEYHAKEDVGRGAIDGPLLSVTWVDEARGEGVKSRVCARPFNMKKKPKDELYTPTPGAATLKTLLALAEVRGQVL